MQTDVRTFNKKKVLIGVRRSYKFKRGVFMDIGTAIYERFLQGEEQALDELVNLYRNSLTSFINGYIGDYDEAEDIMIDVFVDLIQKRKILKVIQVSKLICFPLEETKHINICTEKAVRYLFLLTKLQIFYHPMILLWKMTSSGKFKTKNSIKQSQI